MNPNLSNLLARTDRIMSGPSGRGVDSESARYSSDSVHVGVDLGTAYTVLVVLDENDQPIAGAYQFAEVVRDGLVVDFIGAVDLLRNMKSQVEEQLGFELKSASTGYPPGVPQAEVRASANVLQGAGLDCTGLIDEPSAANNVLRLENGAIVDVGGGTTGVAVLQDGNVVYTADEATGGTHFSLVITGSLNTSFEDAEQLKVRADEQTRLFPLVRPVMEKVATITRRHICDWNVPEITLVGGTSAFRGMAQVVEEVTGIPTRLPTNPLFVTPLGIALHDRVN